MTARAKTTGPRRARRPKTAAAARRTPLAAKMHDARVTLTTWRARAADLLRRHPARAALGAAALAAALSAGIARRV
jgi:hypothetical protein